MNTQTTTPCVTARTATRVIYLDAILYLAGGIVGTGHHWYFTGQGTLNMGLAACFSALEVVPLTLAGFEAVEHLRRGAGRPWLAHYRWPVLFFVAVAFTGIKGKYVKLEDTINGFKMIIDGSLDDIPEQAFYMTGTIEEVIEKAKQIKNG